MIEDIAKDLHIKTTKDWAEVCEHYEFDNAQDGNGSSVRYSSCMELHAAGSVDGQEVTHNIFYNIREDWIHSDGIYDLQCYDLDEHLGVKRLEDLFSHPLFPTESECELFLLDYGFQYPIPCDTLTRPS